MARNDLPALTLRASLGRLLKNREFHIFFVQTMALSKFETTPAEILTEIVLWTVSDSFLGPPTDIINFLLVSKRFWNDLALRYNPYLYSCIFTLKFDIRAPASRLGGESRHLELSTELVKRCQALKRLKSNGYQHENSTQLLRSDLWVAYSMFLESNNKNPRQLIEFANVDQFVYKYVSFGGTLHHGPHSNASGWIVENEENALALWVFWFTDKQRVLSETPAERGMILQALASLFVGSFKYASSHAPITSFRIPPDTPLPNRIPRALSLAASPVSPSCLLPNVFGLELSLSRPLLMPPALLSCVVRLEISIAEINWTSSAHMPATRADAILAGWSGPTQEDHVKQRAPTTRLVEWVDSDNVNELYDHDWTRLRSCYYPWDHRSLRYNVFTPGMLDGVWVGRWFGMPINQFNDILEAEKSGQPVTIPHPPLVYPVPMQFRLREHYQRDPDNVVGFEDISSDGTGRGVFNAWLPKGARMTKVDGNLQIYVPNHTPVTYRTYDISADRGATLSDDVAHEHIGTYGNGIWDIILTAETDNDFGEAWGSKRYYGRVRAWDGLIMLVREATDTEGQWIFRGYLHGMQNLIGLWRETGTSISAPGWEGVWSMTKM